MSVSSGAWAGTVVVLASTSETFRPGEIRDSAEAVSLASGEEIVLNDAAGETRRLTGPYRGRLGAFSADVTSDTDLVRSLSRLVIAREEDRTRVGAIRSLEVNGEVTAHSISVAHSGTQCIETGKPVDLVRPKKFARARILRIRDMETDTVVELSKLKSDAPTFWPEGLPPSAGKRYQAYFPEFQFENEAVVITFARLEPQPSAAARAGAMEAAGCRRQALIVLDQLLAQP